MIEITLVPTGLSLTMPPAAGGFPVAMKALNIGSFIRGEAFKNGFSARTADHFSMSIPVTNIRKRVVFTENLTVVTSMSNSSFNIAVYDGPTRLGLFTFGFIDSLVFGTLPNGSVSELFNASEAIFHSAIYSIELSIPLETEGEFYLIR